MITEAPQVKIGGAFASPPIQVKVGGVFVDAFAPPFDPSVLLTDLVAWWDFEEESGTRFDAHGAYDLTDNNTVGFEAGKTGTNAASFVAANAERLTSSEIAAWRFDKDLTHTLWFKVGALAPAFLTGQEGTSPARSWNVNLTTGGFVRLSFRRDDATNSNNPIGTYTAGAWHHVVVRYDHAEATAYCRVNAGAWVPVDLAGIQTPGEGLSLGGHPNATNDNVALDAVNYWHRTLTEGEADGVYNGGAGLHYSDLSP